MIPWAILSHTCNYLHPKSNSWLPKTLRSGHITHLGSAALPRPMTPIMNLWVIVLPPKSLGSSLRHPRCVTDNPCMYFQEFVYYLVMRDIDNPKFRRLTDLSPEHPHFIQVGKGRIDVQIVNVIHTAIFHATLEPIFTRTLIGWDTLLSPETMYPSLSQLGF